MCGIAGIIATEPMADAAALSVRLRTMMRLVQHRGPDDWGIAAFVAHPPAAGLEPGERVIVEPSEVTVLLGHRRLSIIDLSEDGRQPMPNASGHLWLIFNGEIYNYVELRRELQDSYAFRSQSDSEVILAAYERWGSGLLLRLDGMFAFALWDATRQTLLCARDPLGIKPFYYGRANGVFAFASETRAVLAGLGARGSIDRTRLAEFIVLGMTDHDEGTCYAEVQQLPGGHALVIDTRSEAEPTPIPFWSPPNDIMPVNGGVPEQLYEDIRRAVSWQLRSDVPVGSCLSGGLDSGSIAAAVGDALTPDQRRGYSMLTLTSAGFEGDESALAKATAERTGASWVPVEVTADDVMADIKHMMAVHDQPFSSLSMFGQYCIMKRARELGLKVMLDGQGGDEIFLGYERVAQRSLVQWARGGRVGHALAEWTRLSRHASIPMMASLVANVAYARPSLVAARSRARVAPLVNGDLLRLPRPHIAEEMYGFGDGGVFGLQRRELLRYCLPKLLRFEDRNSMAFGVEARVPLLAKSVVDFALRLPLDWRVHDGWTKYALRKAVAAHLPAEVVWNPRKRGFEVPQQPWVEALHPWLRETLGNPPTAFPIRVDETLKRIALGEGASHNLWRAISAAAWMRLNEVSY
jgi:asparagine synthase (glutamine-hydrolysing)